MARYLLTAGPTREAIDPVRFLSNRSSGRMGYALAAALAARGHEVVLVSGPVVLAVPQGVRRIEVESALEMLAACKEEWPRCDGVFGVAAVADFRPKETSTRKHKRRAGEAWVLEMVPNPDILATLARDKGSRVAVGFALDTHDQEREAVRKMQEKNLDFLVLNGVEAQGAMESRVVLFLPDGRRRSLGPMVKEELALELVELILGFPAGE